MMLVRDAKSLAACLRGLPSACDATSLFGGCQRLLATTAQELPRGADAGQLPAQRGRQRRAAAKSTIGRGSTVGLLAEKQSLKWGQEVVVKVDDAQGDKGRQGRGQRGSSLAHRNAPVKVFQLIGDPRTGVADDTTTKPWGEMTVDLVHEAYRTQVSWYKYDLAGDELQETHRNARLSDYTRNLIYLLRAKDPRRWTIGQLAGKFRIRPQRVLAILASKEMEAQAVERGQLLAGPLRGYALPVHLRDLHLDSNGEPLDFLRLPAESAAPAEAPAHTALTVDTSLSSAPAKSSTGSLTASALGSISEFVDLDSDEPLATSQPEPAADDLAAASSESLPAAVAAVHDMATSLAEGLRGALGLHAFSLDRLRSALEVQLAQADAFCQQHFADCADVAAALELPARRAKVRRLLDAVAPLCTGDGLRLQSAVEHLKGLSQQLQALQPADAAGLDATQQDQLQQVVGKVVALLPASPQPAAVQQLVVALDREGRHAVLEAVEQWRSSLHEAGVDVAALIAMGGRYVAPTASGAEAIAASAQVAPVFGGVEVAEAQLQELQAALLDMADVNTALQGDARQVVGVVQEVRRLWWEYLSADQVGNELLESWGQLLPPDCQALQAAAPVPQSPHESEAGAPDAVKPSQQLVERYGAEHLAAYLDYCVAGRVFDRGSGERHFVRLPTYPAFEGAPVRLLDQVRENELSALNRSASKSEDVALFRQFQDALVDNLGLNEELLGQAGMAVAQRPASKQWSYVVHPYGGTRPLEAGLPSTYVATAGKQLRALNELELQYIHSTDPTRRRKGIR